MRLVDCFIEPAAYILDVVRKPAAFPDYEPVRAKAEALLESSAVPALQLGVSAQDFQDGRFAMCAWMDEAVLGSDWPGRDQWLHQPLQRTIFNTVNAGDEFFVRLDSLLRKAGADPDSLSAAPLTSIKDLDFNPPPDTDRQNRQSGFGPSPAEEQSASAFPAPPEAGGQGTGTRGVLEVFALTLMLGFTGKYFHPDDQDALRNLGRLAKETALGLSSKTCSVEGMRLCPPLYDRQEEPGARRRKFWRGLDVVDMLVVGLPLLMTAAMFYAYGSILSGILGKLWGAN